MEQLQCETVAVRNYCDFKFLLIRGECVIRLRLVILLCDTEGLSYRTTALINLNWAVDSV